MTQAPAGPLSFVEPWDLVSEGYAAEVGWIMFGALRAAEPAMPAPSRNLLSLENPDLFEEELRAAGFADVSVTPYEHFVTVDSADVFCSVMTRSAAPCQLLRKKWGEAEWAERSERSIAFLREQFSGGPLRLSTVAFLGFGRKP